MPTTVTPALPIAPDSPPAPPPVRLRLLGEAAIDVDGMPVGPESQVLFALLLVLALERGRRLARTALHRLLWPGADDDSGRHNLRQVLYKLRQLGVPMDATQSSVMLPTSVVTGELVALTSGDPAIGARLAGGRRVGDFLPGYAPTFSAPFADWLDEQRSLVQAQLRRALLAALAGHRALGQWREVEAVAREVLRADPLNEEATLALAEATALVGAKAQALGIIDRYLDEVGGRPADLKLPATLLRRRIAERFPTHRYVSAADACFVGRATEMATLLGLWHRARERRGGAVLLWGEPGIGKTRLAHELGRVATLQGAQVQRVASRSWDVQRPLGAIVDLVPGLRELPGAAGVDPRCNEYLDRLTKHTPDRPLADLPDPVTLHRQVRQAVFDLVDALLAEAPLVLVLEDVQWLDASSWEVLAELLRLARTRRLLLVLTSRTAHPAQMPESEDWEALRRLRVDGIDATATNALLDAMTREAGKYIDPDYREWCVPLANGNPLHVQEIALQWLEKGSVREAPGSLRAMIETRVRMLPPIALEVLHVTTLARAHAWPVLVSAVLSESEVSLLIALRSLEESGLLRLIDGILVIRHDVIAEYAESSLSDGSRALLHARIARCVVSVAISRGNPSLLWACYKHFSAAQLANEATHSLSYFADYLLQSGKTELCESLLRDALAECSNRECATVLRSKLIAACAHLGHWQQVTHFLEQSDREVAFADATMLLQLYEARWRQDGDVSSLQGEAVALAARTALPSAIRVRAAIWALIFAANAGDRYCYRVTDRIVQPLLGQTDDREISSVQYELIASTQRGDIEATEVAAGRLVELSTRLVNSAEKTRLLRHAAHGLGLAGKLPEAEEALLSAIDICYEAGAVHSLALCEESLSALQFYRHDIARAHEWANKAEISFRSTEDLHSRQSVSFLQLQIALVENDLPAIHDLLDVIGPVDPDDSNLGRAAVRIASHLRAASAMRVPLVNRSDLMERAVAAISDNPASNVTDFIASAVLYSYADINAKQQGVDFFNRYINSLRLRRGALHLDLAGACSIVSSHSHPN